MNDSLSAKKTILRALEEGLAAENRRVLSIWRAGVLLRRATASIQPSERRWDRAPTSLAETRRIIDRLVSRGDLYPLDDTLDLFVVSSPFASSAPVSESEILMELHPWAALSHLTALVFHGLTDQNPVEIHMAVAQADGSLPIGTNPDDWEGGALVRGRLPPSVLNVPVRWHQLKRPTSLGAALYRPQGFPVRVTNPEMTLTDGLQNPEWSGGIDNVFKAWALAVDLLDLDRLVGQVEELGTGLLKQRVGWILEELGLSHPALDSWAANAKRGGSSKLVASAPYAPEFSERWCLSINVPIRALT